nr:RISC-loading complex subunit tarbp2 [Ciona intestinalis]|eukprot:XP_004226748.1 RISC-loading complex subunit tarbp2 [Ciona intestinalis]
MAGCSESQTEDLQNESQTFKTPVSTLQEYCQKLSKTPQYDLTALEGRAHQPQFVYRCMVGDVTATGQGGSKKIAKHAAAEAVLKTLTNGLVEPESFPDVMETSAVEYGRDVDDTNPVGSLQELVVARGWRLPEYALAHETGPAHKKEFIICCTVESFKEYGSGSAKKHAKRLAAANMFTKIMNLPPEAKETVTNQSREAKNKIGLNEICNSVGEKQNFFHVRFANCDQNPCQVLEELANKHSFDAVYKDIEQTTVNGDRQCLLEVSTQPPCVLHGRGKSLNQSHSDAAVNALEYLTIFGNEENYEPTSLLHHTSWNSSLFTQQITL